MTLRAATPEDVPQMASIMGHWFEVTPFAPRLHTNEEDCWFLNRAVAQADATVVTNGADVQGFIIRDDAEIGQLYIAEAARGQGLGGQLLELMKGRTDHLALWCFQANAPARRFYENHGFAATDFTDGLANEERTPDVRYAWRRG